MRRIIRIFLASSIVEFANERMAIENFIRNISDKFEENYDVKIQPLLCENFDDAYSKIRKQEEYNEKIRNSDLCFFIFFTKAGEYTREEFEVARKKFEETGKPKIYTYFKVIKDETAEQSLYDFMDELDKIFGHYYGTFEHIDTVKLRILLNLKLQEMDFLEIKVDGDTCVVDGKKTLSLENVSEFANNSIFQELKAELYEIEERYFKLKAKYEKDECSQSEEHEYIEIASKRQNLIDAIEETQKNIFNMSLRMCQDEARGEITLRQKEAYRLFESGDLEGANNILDFTEIENDYLRDIAIMESNMRKRSEIFIRETKTKIDILATMIKLSTRFTEIEKLYDKIVPVIFKYIIEVDVLFEYIAFLYNQNKHQKAYEIAKRTKSFISDSVDDEKMVRLYVWLGLICSDLVGKKTESEEIYIKSVKKCEKLVKINPERFNPVLATLYNNCGLFYYEQGQLNTAEEYYNKAITIREKLAEVGLEKIGADIVASYHNMGAVYSELGQCGKAEGYYEKLISVSKKLAEINPNEYISYPAMGYITAGNFYKNQEQTEKAENYYNKAITICEDLVKKNPVRFSYNLGICYDYIGDFYNKNGQIVLAEKYYKKAIKIRIKLSNLDPGNFNLDLADSYITAGNFYINQGQAEKAEKNYKKALSIREKLSESNPEKFSSYLAVSYNNIGGFYYSQGQQKTAEKYLKQAIKLYEKLAETDFESFNPKYAVAYYNYAIFTQNKIWLEKALQLAKTMPENAHCKKIIEALEGE